jgi:hypothetical protein
MLEDEAKLSTVDMIKPLLTLLILPVLIIGVAYADELECEDDEQPIWIHSLQEYKCYKSQGQAWGQTELEYLEEKARATCSDDTDYVWKITGDQSYELFNCTITCDISQSMEFNEELGMKECVDIESGAVVDNNNPINKSSNNNPINKSINKPWGFDGFVFGGSELDPRKTPNNLSPAPEPRPELNGTALENRLVNDFKHAVNERENYYFQLIIEAEEKRAIELFESLYGSLTKPELELNGTLVMNDMDDINDRENHYFQYIIDSETQKAIELFYSNWGNITVHLALDGF